MTWTRAEDDDLGAIFEAVARPWPAALARLWLRHAEGAAAFSRPYWLPKDAPAQVIASMQRRESPGRRALAHVAGLPERQARTVLEDGCWRDPYAQESADRPGSVPPASRVPSRVRPGSEPENAAATVTDRPGSVPPASRVPSRVRPDRARVSLDPNKNPQPDPEEADRDLTATPPPAEPSGSPSDLWLAAADLADPEAWRASEEFQLSTNAYVFEEAEPVGVPEQPSVPRPIESPAARAPEAPPQGFRPSPTHPPGNGEGAPRPATSAQDAPSLFGRIDTAPEAQKPAKAPPRASKPQPPPVDLTSPDDPCPLLLGAKVSINDLTEGIVTVYRSWWRRQPSPATCKITVGRVKLIRQALEGGCSVEQLVHLVRYAYEAADIGTYQRAWRGEDGKTPPDLEMLLRGDKFERNVEISGRWNVERIGESPGPLPENVHPFPMPTPPRAPFRKATTAELMQALANM